MLSIRYVFSSFLVGFILFASINPTFAQRAGTCGTNCPPEGCQVGKYCSNGTCFETGCNPAAGDSACCKSQRPRQPRTPTSPPSGGNPSVPGVTSGVNVPNVPGIKPVTPGNDQVTPPNGGRGGVAGDCSSPVEGTKDGVVDLNDFNLLRKEFSGSVATAFCDFDTNGTVDLLDFNIQRIALIAQK